MQLGSCLFAGVLVVSSIGCVASEDTTSAISSDDTVRPVDTAKELVITDPRVIASPVETTFDPAHPSGFERQGAWSFGRLIHNMLPEGERDSAYAASQLVLRWLATWETAQAPNPAVEPARARASIRLMITNPWKAASGCTEPESPASDAACTLDMTKAPFRLMAIVNRPDLRKVADDDSAIGGEGRFVFQVVGPTLGIDAATSTLRVMDATVKPQKFTVIFEYSLPVTSWIETTTWARRWHALGALPFGAAYNAQLLAITRDFSGPDQDRRRPNGNALDQLRTNEVALMGARFPATGFVAAKQFWEIREFHLETTGLEPHTVNLEPARDFDITRTGQTGAEGTRTAELVAYLDANADAVLASRHVLADGMSGNSALVGSSPYGAWGKLVGPNPPAIPSQGVAHNLGDVAVAVRDSFAINTCAGCHRHETDTRHFMHLTFVGAMEPAARVDDRARIGADTLPDTAVVMSNFLRAEVSPGGPRYEDFTRLLATPVTEITNKPGLRSCE
ncbi:MAG TPA: hypothetical protein VFQ53_01190 [Kofleriaceae bacterium]|nr:hypothetical protein [Kofleriaceae bacterium]